MKLEGRRSLNLPSTLLKMNKTPPMRYGKSAVYFDTKRGRMRLYSTRGDKVEKMVVLFTKETVRVGWDKIKTELMRLNP